MEITEFSVVFISTGLFSVVIYGTEIVFYILLKKLGFLRGLPTWLQKVKKSKKHNIL